MSSFWNDVYGTTHPGQDTDNSNIIIVNFKLPEILNNIYSTKKRYECFLRLTFQPARYTVPKASDVFGLLRATQETRQGDQEDAKL